MDLIELAKKPVSDDKPGGEDARSEPDYEEMSGEVDKLANPSASGGVDWAKVSQLATSIISDKSKDIMAASYLAVSLLQTDKIPGLEKGLGFFRAFLETHWETMFPPLKRIRGRGNAVEWLYEQGESFLRDFQAQPVPEETLKSINENFDAIDSFLAEKMEESPSSRGLRDAIGMIPVVSKEAPKPAASAAQAPAAAGGAIEVVGEITSPADAQKVLNSSFKLMRQAAAFYFEQNNANPLAYSLMRMAAWTPVAAAPPAENGITKIPPPPDQVKTVFSGLQSGGDWAGLLKAAESRVPQFLFWLDLSRMVHDCLGQLGADHAQAQEAVARETAAFVRRLKGVEGLSFSDETPFADPETKKWIREISAGAGQGDGLESSSAAGAGKEGDELSEEYENARKLAKAKKLPEAVALLSGKLTLSPAGKTRMMWRMALARILLDSNKLRTAQPQLDKIIEDIERHGLERWDPELALEGYKVVLSAVRDLKDEASRALAAKTLDRIASLDPGEALKLELK